MNDNNNDNSFKSDLNYKKYLKIEKSKASFEADLDNLTKKLYVYDDKNISMLKNFVGDHQKESADPRYFFREFVYKIDKIVADYLKNMIYTDKNNWKAHSKKIKSYLKYNVDLLFILLDKKLTTENEKKLKSLKKSIDRFDNVNFLKIAWHFIKNLVFIFVKNARFNLANLRMSKAFDEYVKVQLKLSKCNNKITGCSSELIDFGNILGKICGGPFDVIEYNKKIYHEDRG